MRVLLLGGQPDWEMVGMFHGITPTEVVPYDCRQTDPGLVALYHYDAVRDCDAVVIVADQWSNTVQHLAHVAWRYFRPLHVGPVEIDPTQFAPAVTEIDLFS